MTHWSNGGNQPSQAIMFDMSVKDVRLIRNVLTGQSRGFAFLEFLHLQDATRWMEANQHCFTLHGQRVSVNYSKPKVADDWFCSKCFYQNFKRREQCFKCGSSRVACGEAILPTPLNSLPVGGEMSSDNNANNTLIIRNLNPMTTVDSIISALAPYVMLTPSNIRLIKDKITNMNRGFAFIELASVLEASQLLQILNMLRPPLSVDDKIVNVDYAKGTKRESSSASVASLAIAAAHWSATQGETWPGQSGQAEYPNGEVHTSEGYADYNQSAASCESGQAGASTTVTYSANATLSAAPVLNTTATAGDDGDLLDGLPTTAGCAAQGGAQGDSTQQESNLVPPTGTQPYQKYPVPDVSTYQYDESSGYYYDPQTGLYYDSTSQYYYNSQTQEYLYWDGEKQTYLSAASRMEQQSNQDSKDKEGKEKKEKPKNKTAQQIAKDMERWAKSLNKQKELFKNSFQPIGPGGRDDDRKESATADAGYAMLEKRAIQAEKQMTVFNQIQKIQEKSEEELKKASSMLSVTPSALVASYGGGSDSEDEGPGAEGKEDRLTDWAKMACLLCRRQFPSKEALIRHQQLSDLHRQNMEVHRRSRLSTGDLEELERKERDAKYRDRAAERREKYGIPDPPEPKRKRPTAPEPTINFEQPTKDGLTADNIGSKMMKAMGWNQGTGLGKKEQGITLPIEAQKRIQGAGLGARGATYGTTATDTYKDHVRRAMMMRFSEME
uniref:RNA-binding protein 10-like isoform X3 n=1 Tax=Myxine glutinosa TaxID=7769 RepID=UPI00358FACB1